MKIINVTRTCDKDARTCTVHIISSLGEFEATAHCHEEDNMYMGVGYTLATQKAFMKLHQQLLKNLKKEYRGVCKFLSTVESIVHQNNVNGQEVLDIANNQKKLLEKNINELTLQVQREKDGYAEYAEKTIEEQKYVDKLYEKVLNSRK